MKTYLFLLCLSLSFVACKDFNSEKNNEASNDESETSISGDKFQNPDFVEKYNVYIDFGNSFQHQAMSSYDNYFSWADLDKGPKADTEHAYQGISTLPDYSIKNLEEALNKDPKIEKLDPLVKDVLEKAKPLTAKVEEAHNYYSREDYKDDNFAKGEAMHNELKSLFDAYFDSYAKMTAEFSILQNQFFEYDAARFQKDGSDIQYNLMMNLHEAEVLLGVIDVKDGEELKTIDMNAFDSASENFRKSYDNLENLNKDEANFKKEFGDDSFAISDINSYMREAGDMIKNIRSLKERIAKSDFKYSIVHESIPDEGSPSKISEIYRDLVSQYNSVIR